MTHGSGPEVINGFTKESAETTGGGGGGGGTQQFDFLSHDCDANTERINTAASLFMIVIIKG
jgi:hypothetical protein